MITTQNYFQKVKQMNISDLPKKLKEGHDFVKEVTENHKTWDYYKSDDDIKSTVNEYLANLSDFLNKHTPENKTASTSGTNEHEAREAAKKLIRAYVHRGDTVQSLKQGQLGTSTGEFSASIKGNKIQVDKANKKKVNFSFPLQSIYNEVSEEKGTKVSKTQQNNSARAENKQQYEKQAKELAKKLLKPFVLKGNSLRSFGTGRISGSSTRNYVQVDRDTVNVTSVDGKKVDFIFSLKALYNEIEKEVSQTNHKRTHADNVKPVERVDDEVRFIKRYGLMHGKIKTDMQILNFINSLQKAIVEKRIRKSSPYAKEIDYIQTNLVKLYNVMDKKVEIKIHDDVLEKFISIGGSEKVRLSITYLKRYIGIQGKKLTKEKAQRLLELLKNAARKGQLTKNDPYVDRLNRAYGSLVKFVEMAKKDDTLQIHPAVLNGISDALDGCCCDDGLDGIDEALSIPDPESNPATQNTVMNSMDFAEMKFETLGFSGKWKELIGDPCEGFTAMVFGKPKMGKSYLCVELAGYLARHHGDTLYVANEEKLDATLQTKLNDKNVKHQSLFVSDYLPDDLSPYQFIVLDSVNKLGLTPQDLERLKAENPGKSFIYIFQTTKEGNFRGANEFQHQVDVVIEVPEKGKAVQYGRFNQGGEMEIFGGEG